MHVARQYFNIGDDDKFSHQVVSVFMEPFAVDLLQGKEEPNISGMTEKILLATREQSIRGCPKIPQWV